MMIGQGVLSKSFSIHIKNHSKGSKKLHVNCFDKDSLEKYLYKFFNNVFTFGMNDEVLHTGYDKMCHYVFAICIK